MGETKDEWWVSRGGQRFGPVDFATLVESAQAGRLEPRSDLVIGGDLEDWVPAGEVDGIFERSEPEVGDEETAGHKPPNDSMADSGSYDFGEKQTQLKLPGAPRLGYILGVTVLPTILIIGLGKILPQLQSFAGPDIGRFVPLVVFVIPTSLVLAITVKRFQNLGMNGWWILGLLVPLLNWWLNYRLIACPPGYVFTKKLDVWGWILAVLYWLSIIGSIVAAVLFGAVAIKQLVESGEWQQIKNQIEIMRSEAPPAQ